MIHADIALTDDQCRMLEHIAAGTRRSLSEVIQQAVDVYMREQRQEALRNLDALAARIRSDIPSGISQEETEADITAAREEYRMERREQPHPWRDNHSFHIWPMG